MIKVKVKENSWLARLAARTLKANNVAMVIGKTIYLHNASKDHFLEDKKWLKHELMHVIQQKKMGTLPFLWCYMIESLKKGYHNNRFEVEARVAENLEMSELKKYLEG